MKPKQYLQWTLTSTALLFLAVLAAAPPAEAAAVVASTPAAGVSFQSGLFEYGHNNATFDSYYATLDSLTVCYIAVTVHHDYDPGTGPGTYSNTTAWARLCDAYKPIKPCRLLAEPYVADMADWNEGIKVNALVIQRALDAENSDWTYDWHMNVMSPKLSLLGAFAFQCG